MSWVEIAALAIVVGAAVALVLLHWWWDRQDRRPLISPEPERPPIRVKFIALDPPARPEESDQDHRPRHADWGQTTRLRPPD